jgi:hypothetical protein
MLDALSPPVSEHSVWARVPRLSDQTTRRNNIFLHSLGLGPFDCSASNGEITRERDSFVSAADQHVVCFSFVVDSY